MVGGEPSARHDFAEFAQGTRGSSFGPGDFSADAVVAIGLVDFQCVLRGKFGLHLLDVLGGGLWGFE